MTLIRRLGSGWIARIFAMVGLAAPADEAQLIARVIGGGSSGRDAFRQLIRPHQQWLVNFLVALLGNTADAEDVAQEVLMKAHQGLPAFRQTAKLRTWLRRIAINEAYNARRRRREQLTRDGEAPEVSVTDLGARAVEERQIVLAVLDQLSYSYREVLTLRYVECMDLKAIAAQLDIGVPAVKMRLRRARDQFEAAYVALLGAPR